MAPHNTPRPQESGSLLDQINAKLDQVLERLAAGDTTMALLGHRVNFLEKIVFGLCSFVLLAVLGAVVAIVVHPPAAADQPASAAGQAKP